MAKTPIFDPGTSEVRSPLLAGLSEGISKLSDILNLKTDTATITLQNIPITDEDKNRIYQAANGKRLWLDNPAPVIYKNGEVISETDDFFEIDHVGGSISFDRNYRLKDSDIVTARVTYLINQSTTISNINDLIDEIGSQKPVLIQFSVSPSEWDSGKTTIRNNEILSESKYFYILGFPAENVESYEGSAIWADDIAKKGEMVLHTKLEQEDNLNFVLVRFERNEIDPQSTGAKVISQILGGGGGSSRPANIKITNPPTRTEYYAGDVFDKDGMIVEVTYDNGFTTETTAYTWEPSGPLEYGTDIVTIILKEGGKTVTAEQKITVIREEVAIPYQDTHLVYNKGVQQANFIGYDPSKMSISGGYFSRQNAGSYTTIFKLSSVRYEWPDHTTDDKEVTWVIDRFTIETVPSADPVRYTESEVYPVWKNYDPTQLEIGGQQSGTEPETYTATFTPIQPNYQWEGGDISTKEVQWRIYDPTIIVTIPKVSGSITYNGGTQKPVWVDFDEEHCDIGGETEGIDATTYTATFTLHEDCVWSDNETGPKNIEWTIDRATIESVPSQSGTLTYTGGTLSPAWDTHDPAKLDISGDKEGIDADTYTANFTPTKNYKWFDESIESKPAEWVIGKATGTLSATQTSVELNKNHASVVVTIESNFDGEISAVSNDSNVADANATDMQVTISTTEDTYGNTTVTVSAAEGDKNHTKPDDISINVTAGFWYLYGFDIQNSNQDPDARVSYPDDVDNKNFDKAKMDFLSDTFSYGGWNIDPGKKFMPRPCMLNYSGTVAYYLNPNNYAEKDGGGSSDISDFDFDGNAMMEWPKIYTKRWEEGGVYHFRCSDTKVDSDYECWCNYDKNNKEIDNFYTPIYFGSKDTSGKLRSISGQANWVGTGNAQNEIDAAKLNGENIWYTEVVADRFLEQDLLVMMFKSTDLQAAIGNGVSNGSIVDPGTLDGKGMFWGTTANTTTGVKAFGMENLWANLWRRTAGWINANGTQKFKLTRGTKDGTTVADYNLDGSGYLTVFGATPSGSSGGYISSCVTQKFGRVTAVASGSSTTNECDGMWFNNDQVNYAAVGGSYSIDTYCGPFTASIHNAASIGPASRGAALSCKPLAEIQNS